MKDIGRLLIAFINFIFGLSVIGLFIRFMFRLFGADPEAPLAEFVYVSTSPLLDPFRSLFRPYVIEPGLVFEFTTLIAIVFYVFIAWLLAELIAYITYRGKSSYRA